MKNVITLKEIAAMAGVTPKTAERALSGVTLGVRKDARERAERVRRIAAEMAYSPSEAAVNLRRGSTRTIGILINRLTDIFQAAAVETIADEARKSGYKAVLKLALFDQERTAEELRELLASGADGILNLCSASQFSRKMMNGLKKRKLPFLTLLQDVPKPLASSQSVIPDYTEAVRNAVADLAGKGHQKILLSLFADKGCMNRQCTAVFRKCCRARGITGTVQICANLQEVRESVGIAPDGVILFGKYSIRTFHDECLRLKKKVALAGFLNEWIWPSVAGIPLTGAIIDPAEKLVRCATRKIVAEIEGTTYRQPKLAAQYIPAERFHKLHWVNLTNQYLYSFND